MKHKKEMDPDLFAQQPEESWCGVEVAVAVVERDLRYFSILCILEVSA